MRFTTMSNIDYFVQEGVFAAALEGFRPTNYEAWLKVFPVRTTINKVINGCDLEITFYDDLIVVTTLSGVERSFQTHGELFDWLATL